MSMNMIAEVAPEYNFIPGETLEIDEQTRQYLAKIILDDSVEVEPSERGSTVKYTELKDKELIGLFSPLIDVLQLDPLTDEPPRRRHFVKASKLGLTPSMYPIYERMSLSAVQEGLGFKSRFKFNEWTSKDYVIAGQQLAATVGGRPSRDDIIKANKGDYEGVTKFPSVDELKTRFGKLSIYDELIGYPTCKGWVKEDYMDWSAAFYRQNPGLELTTIVIDELSKRGVGPSRQPLYKYFGSFEEFKSLAKLYFIDQIETEAVEHDNRLSKAKELAESDGLYADLLKDLGDDDVLVLQVTAQHRLAKYFFPQGIPASLTEKGLKASPDEFVRECRIASGRKISAADIETSATVLGVFDDLWPMYRFENVNLKRNQELSEV